MSLNTPKPKPTVGASDLIGIESDQASPEKAHESGLRDTTNSDDHDPEQLQLLHVDQYAFDEMNLVEIPFCLLENSDRRAGKTVPLSPTGTEFLEAGKKRGLPTALAMRAVLGLMWLIKDQNGFTNRIVRCSVRSLVEDYMYPGRYKNYRAPGKLLRSVEDQLHRVAATRLYTKRWYNKDLRKHTEMDASIIDYIETIQEGGRNSRRYLEIALGSKVFQSVQAKYTKRFDVVTWMQITHPLDQALFRWLDRQLHGDKTRQAVASIQNFGRYKLLMQGKVASRGGRTASNYILKKLTEALERLNGLGFAVRLTPDKSKPDYSLLFERIEGESNEVIDADPVADLVFEFKRLFHNATKKTTRGRTRESDRRIAAEWIAEYGLEKALWMVGKCLDLHRQSKHAASPRYSFAGLEIYESVAVAAFGQTEKEKYGQLMLLEREQREMDWLRYREVMAELAERQLSEEEKAHIELEAEEELAKSAPLGLGRDINLKINIKSIRLSRIGAMREEEFLGFESNEDLDEALVARHGKNPLQAASLA